MTTLHSRKSIGRLPWALAVCVAMCTLAQGFSANAQERNITFITFDAPGAGTGPGQGTNPFNINPAGAITGPYVDASNVGHGFLRDKNGAITTFDAPGAGTGPFQGTVPFCNNPPAGITGYYIDASNVGHGFLVVGE